MTLIASLAIPVGSAVGDDPIALQQRAIQRIDGYIDRFRKTGDLTSLLPDLQQADVELAASYEVFLRRGNREAAALSWIKRGDIGRLRNQWQQAVAFYQQAHQLAEKAAHRGYQAKALTGQARAEAYGLRDYGSAGVHIAQAIRLSAMLSDPKELFNSLDVMAQIQISRGELIAAAETLSRAFSVANAIEDQTVLYYAYFDRADIYQKLAEKCDYQRTFEPCYEALTLAQADYERALSLARKLGYAGLAGQTEGFLRRLGTRREMIQSQENFHKQLLQGAIFRPQKPSDVLAHEQFLTGSQNLPAGLLGLIQQSGAFGGGDARSFYAQGLFHQLQGANDAALPAYLKAVELLEADRRRLRDDKSRGTFLEDKIEFYYTSILHLLERRRMAEAFELLERSRARGMSDLLASKTLVLSRPKDRELYAESLKVRVQIARLQQELFADRRRADRDRYIDRITNREREIRKLEAEHSQLLSRMAKEAPKLPPLVVSEPVPLQQLQQSMKRDRYEMLQYLVLESAVLLWHISGDAIQVRSVFLPRSELIQKVAELRKSLGDVKETFNEQIAREMFLFLIQPVLPSIKTNHLVIVPHEDLYYVPFQVFQDPSDRTYLGERFRLSYAPSATIFSGLRKAENVAGGRLLAVADPTIPEARKEVDFLASLYPGRHKVVSDVLVKEADLKSWVADYDVHHFSVHGEFSVQEPLLSYLKLNAGGQDDGKLTAAEIFGLPLEQSRLVVLSACETGQAQATHGNEVLGMVRALLYGGANTLILSGWKVNAASTGLWMQTFYQEAQSRSVGEAARLALMTVKQQPQYNHPFYWGPFLLIGR
jgi:CHAT domain-containing protein